MDLTAQCKEITAEYKCDFCFAEAKDLTTFKGGGRAGVFSPKSEKQFASVYAALKDCGYSPIILGGGSNTVIADGFLLDPIISTRKLDAVSERYGCVYAECGASLFRVSAALRRQSMSGFDFLSGVPATLGGALRMNAGAFSQQIGDYVREIRVLKPNYGKYGKYYDIIHPDSECAEYSFSYRRGTDRIVLGATLVGEIMSADESLARSKKYAALRAAKQPKLPSCGSVFKNGAQPSGMLIEQCGLKGVRVGGAQISEVHANFIVNIGGATAGDFMSLVELCEKRVEEKFGVKLEREFVYLDNGEKSR